MDFIQTFFILQKIHQITQVGCSVNEWQKGVMKFEYVSSFQITPVKSFILQDGWNPYDGEDSPHGSWDHHISYAGMVWETMPKWHRELCRAWGVWRPAQDANKFQLSQKLKKALFFFGEDYDSSSIQRKNDPMPYQAYGFPINHERVLRILIENGAIEL